MALPVKLRAVVDQIEMTGDEMTAYINRKTGDLITLTDEDLSYAEDGDNDRLIPDWQRETVDQVKQVLANDEYIALPDSFEIHEYKIMEHFCYTIEDERVQNILLQAISGKGAFRHFKNKVYEEGINKNWRRFRDSAFKQIAVGFLENQGIAFTD
ncbi:hypothetical protein OA238_c45190 [Octadecabacter arcticus 238]|uniref:Uncharacterized protein n=1 Tax=Octadecabacter arcticus 238 TaxID=391616 RepID=M9RRN7_9RHOB|nr:UPF0158 family protein [Octadecabacter arcticus]AGI74388.1 hypothetical protein OA238_c45190 [Octadecabacter arcticus 238]